MHTDQIRVFPYAVTLHYDGDLEGDVIVEWERGDGTAGRAEFEASHLIGHAAERAGRALRADVSERTIEYAQTGRGDDGLSRWAMPAAVLVAVAVHLALAHERRRIIRCVEEG